MLDCIAKLKKRGKRKRKYLKPTNSPWGYHQQQLFKSHTDAGKAYKVENWTKPQKKTKFPK